jgi:hypothetical protein
MVLHVLIISKDPKEEGYGGDEEKDRKGEQKPVKSELYDFFCSTIRHQEYANLFEGQLTPSL